MCNCNCGRVEIKLDGAAIAGLHAPPAPSIHGDGYAFPPLPVPECQCAECWAERARNAAGADDRIVKLLEDILAELRKMTAPVTITTGRYSRR